MQLKDDKGRTVLVKCLWAQNSQKEISFWAFDGKSLEQVDEAVVAKGDEVFLSREFIENELTKTGVRAAMIVPPKIEDCRYGPVHVEMCSGTDGWLGSNARKTHTINGVGVTEAEMNLVYGKVQGLDSFNGLRYSEVDIGASRIPFQTVLELAGEGKVITPKSIEKGCAKGENKPRLEPGDTVEVDIRGEKVLGTVKGMASKVSVLRQDGQKGSYPYSKVVRASGSAYSDSIVGELDASLKANFDFLKGQTKRIYRAKLGQGDWAFPLFPDEETHEQQITVKDALTCYCPLCGWKMADARNNGEFQCCYCRVRGIVIEKTEEEVSLLMMRWPAKNRFALKECRCCANCGLFAFEYGRQGKRTTGYCSAANQCVQAFNTCGVWFPREAKTYESNLRQHTTNLGYGIDDHRNTSRNDIRDTVYRKEDHEAERKRSERARIVYEQAYIKTMEELKELAKQAPLNVGALDDESVKKWQEVLDDPC